MASRRFYALITTVLAAVLSGPANASIIHNVGHAEAKSKKDDSLGQHQKTKNPEDSDSDDHVSDIGNCFDGPHALGNSNNYDHHDDRVGPFVQHLSPPTCWIENTHAPIPACDEPPVTWNLNPHHDDDAIRCGIADSSPLACHAPPPFNDCDHTLDPDTPPTSTDSNDPPGNDPITPVPEPATTAAGALTALAFLWRRPRRGAYTPAPTSRSALFPQ